MRTLIEQMRRTLVEQMYFTALMIALALPDMCGALAAKNGRSSEKNYRKWLEDHDDRQPAESQLIYKFRCSLLHQGSALTEMGTRVAFVEPGASTVSELTTVSETGERVAWIDIETFVERMATAAEKWLDDNESSELVKANLERFARRRPEGLPPHATNGAVYA